MHKLFKFLVKYKYEILLTLFSFILLYYFKKSFPVTWDDFRYIEKIYLHERSNLLLGRPGFVYFFMAIWDILRTLFNLSIFEFHHVVRLFNIAFGSLTVLFLYLTVKKIFKNDLIAMGSALIFLFSMDFIRFNSYIITEPMMLFFVILSFYFYTVAFEKKKPIYLYLSAFLFGYAFEVHEPALFFILFFPAFYICKKDLKIFSSKNYLVFVAIMLITALSGPLLIYLNEGQGYIESIAHVLSMDKTLTLSSSINSFSPLFTEKVAYAYNLLRSDFGCPSLLFALLGAFVLLFKKRYKELLIVLSLFVPDIIFTFYANGTTRYFISGYFALSMLASVFLFYLTAGICRSLNISKYRKHVFFLFLFVLLCFNFINFHNLWVNEANYTKHLESLGLNLTKNFPAENTVFLLGDEKSPLIDYYLVLSNSKQEVICSGWEWPSQKLNETIMNYLSENKTIVVDTNLSQFSIEEQREEMEQLISSYELENASMGLFIIKEKS